MPDALGWRKKFAVLVPSTNTSVQPEFDSMRPAGVTNHISRIRNTAIYRHALRASGISDKVSGWGPLPGVH